MYVKVPQSMFPCVIRLTHPSPLTILWPENFTTILLSQGHRLGGAWGCKKFQHKSIEVTIHFLVNTPQKYYNSTPKNYLSQIAPPTCLRPCVTPPNHATTSQLTSGRSIVWLRQPPKYLCSLLAMVGFNKRCQSVACLLISLCLC